MMKPKVLLANMRFAGAFSLVLCNGMIHVHALFIQFPKNKTQLLIWVHLYNIQILVKSIEGVLCSSLDMVLLYLSMAVR